MENPVPVPDDVLEILKRDHIVRTAIEDQVVPSGRPPQNWFSAALVHLGSRNLVDLVVAAKGPLAGGNVLTFWVFLATAHGHHLVMTASVHNLRIEKTRQKGYRDIEVSSMSAIKLSTVLCQFNGEQYVEYRSSVKPIR